MVVLQLFGIHLGRIQPLVDIYRPDNLRVFFFFSILMGVYIGFTALPNRTSVPVVKRSHIIASVLPVTRLEILLLKCTPNHSETEIDEYEEQQTSILLGLGFLCRLCSGTVVQRQCFVRRFVSDPKVWLNFPHIIICTLQD